MSDTWRRRIRSTPTEAVLLFAVLLVPILGTIILRSATQESPGGTVVPLGSALVEDTFTAQRKVQSAETRKNLWSEGFEDARVSPLFGRGLGHTYEVARAAVPGDPLVGGGYHNVLLDIAVRRGLVGLGLFAVAVAASLSDALRVWLRHRDRAVAVFGVACAAACTGLLAKAMVESVFEKFRLAVALGFLLGAIAAAASSNDERTSMDERADELALVGP